MSTWFSWAKAAPGVMVERVDAVVDETPSTRAAGDPESAVSDGAVGVRPGTPPVAIGAQASRSVVRLRR